MGRWLPQSRTFQNCCQVSHCHSTKTASRMILLAVLISNLYVMFGVNGELCEPNHVIAHPHNDTLLFICDIQGIYQLFPCPEGLHFNPSKPGCDLLFKGEEEHEGYDMYEVGDDHMVGHPANKMTHDASNSDPLMGNYGDSLNSEYHEGSDVEENPETADDDHIMMKRDSTDPETKYGEQLYNFTSDTYYQHFDYEGNTSLPVENEENNSVQRDILKLKSMMLSFYYLLSPYPLSIPLHGENKTYYGFPLGYNTSDNLSKPGDNSSNESRDETDSTELGDKEDTSQTDEKEGSFLDTGSTKIHK